MDKKEAQRILVELVDNLKLTRKEHHNYLLAINALYPLLSNPAAMSFDEKNKGRPAALPLSSSGK